MKAYKTILSIMFTVFIIVSCSDQIVDPVNSSINNLKSLAKIISPYYTWTTYTYWDPLYQQWFTQCNPTYSFTFSNYNYNLSYSRQYNPNRYFTNYITVNVNGAYYTTITWTNSDDPINPRTVTSSYFTVSGQSMNMAVNLTEFYNPMSIHSEPYTVRVSLVVGR